ncbi:MAG: hypothetical protein Q8M34_11140, partial [Thermodesulfovibrionales bacterium]|nr:hypothetical protein [Thermodesulfovibrionales bacterium]
MAEGFIRAGRHFKLENREVELCFPYVFHPTREINSAGLRHSTAIKDIAFAALNKAFRLPVKVEDWFGKGPDRAHRADLGTAEGTADALFEFCASFVIEKRHYYIII